MIPLVFVGVILLKTSQFCLKMNYLGFLINVSLLQKAAIFNTIAFNINSEILRKTYWIVQSY